MKILITNDDGIRAEGLAVLAAAARPLGSVAVVAPDRERSACGHGMTMREVLRAKELNYGQIASVFDWGDLSDVRAFEVNGLPTDCVNVGLNVAYPDGCDLVLSGINNGPNLGFDITYSGTVAGAMEGAINSIRSISVSMGAFVEGAPLHYETAMSWLHQNLRKLVEAPLPPLTFLNVNIPAIADAEIRGTRITRMGERVYEDRVEPREDPWGRRYFWQGGYIAMKSEVSGTDINAVCEGFVSVTPVSLDWTRHDAMNSLQQKIIPHA